MKTFDLTRKRTVAIVGILFVSSTLFAANNMTTWTFRQGGFSVSMPGQPEYEPIALNYDGKPITGHTWKVRIDGSGVDLYRVAFSDLPRIDLEKEARDFVKAMNGTVTKEGTFQINGHPGRYAIGSGTGTTFYYFSTSSGNRLYQWLFATSSTAPPGPNVKEFVDSFKLLP